METIVEKFVLELESQLRERRVAITLTPEARAYLAKKGYDPVYGARPLARLIQAEVRDPLTDEILFGRLRERRHGHDRREGRRPGLRDGAGAGRAVNALLSRLSARAGSMPVYRLDERLVFPPPDEAEDGLLAVGRRPQPRAAGARLLAGHLPLVRRGQPILWHSPDPRMVLLAHERHVPKSLAKVMRRASFRLTLDTGVRRRHRRLRPDAAPRPAHDLDHAGDEEGVRRAPRARSRPFGRGLGRRASWSAGSTASRSAPRSSASRCSRTRPDASKVAFATLLRAARALGDPARGLPGAHAAPRALRGDRVAAAALPARPARRGPRAHPRRALAIRRGPQPAGGASHRPSGVSASQGR